MKIIIALSLLLNLAFGVALVWDQPTGPVAAGLIAALPHASKNSSSARVAARRNRSDKTPAPTQSVAASIPSTSKLSWNSIEASDFKVYIANLRTIECPEETIRDIIAAEVDKLYSGKFKALYQRRLSEYKYWRRKQWGEVDLASYRQETQWTKEKHDLLITLLGVDPEKELARLNGETDDDATTYAFLNETKRDAALGIVSKFEELEEDIRRKFRGYQGDEYQAELKACRDRRKAELATLLTPHELEEFELRNSPLADNLSWEMHQFDGDEQEYRALFKIKQTFQNVLGDQEPDPDDKAAQKKWEAATEAMDEEIKSALGTGRYKEYQRSQDYQYQQLAQTVRREGLPADTAAKVYDLRDAANEQAEKIRGNESLTDEQRSSALKAIKTETQSAIAATLGEKAFKFYKKQSGDWMQDSNL